MRRSLKEIITAPFVKRVEPTILPINSQLKAEPFVNYEDLIPSEQQLYRVKTDLNNFASALLLAENINNRNRYTLLQCYQEMSIDSFIQGLINQRFSAIKSSNMLLIDANGDALLDQSSINTKWFNEFLELSHQSLFWGFSYINITGIEGGVVDGVQLVPRAYCRPDFDIISQTQQGNSGNSILEEPLLWSIVPVYKSKHDLGIYKTIFKYWVMKTSGEINWSQFQEKFGTPIMVGQTDMLNKQSRDQMAKMLANQSKSLWAVIGNDDKINMLAPNHSGDTFDIYLKYINEQLAISILGQTLTSTSQTGGTEHLGKIHSSILSRIIEEDKEFISNVVNDKLMPILIKYGVLPEGTKFKFIEENDKLSTSELIDNVVKLSSANIGVDIDWLSKELNIPLVPINSQPTASGGIPVKKKTINPNY